MVSSTKKVIKEETLQKQKLENFVENKNVRRCWTDVHKI